MSEKESQAWDVISECDKTISNGEVNSFGSYDEGVRDALLWIYGDGPRPFIGREE